jgi:hypothetical protein
MHLGARAGAVTFREPRSGRCTLPGNSAPLCRAATPSRRIRRVPRRCPWASCLAVGPAAFGARLRAACRSPVSCLRAGYPCCVNRFLLSGPEGHPFHPLLVPLPIGAFVSSLIFDILTRTRAHGLPYLVDGAYWLIGVGLIGALVAAVFGLLDLRMIPRRHQRSPPRGPTWRSTPRRPPCSRSATRGGPAITWNWTRPGGPARAEHAPPWRSSSPPSGWAAN